MTRPAAARRSRPSRGWKGKGPSRPNTGARPASTRRTRMPMRLGMLGMWHTHADGLVRQVAAHPDEFTLAAFYDPDPEVVADRRRRWGPQLRPLRVLDRPEALLREPLDGVVVEGRVYDNLRLARLALESGRPVLLEKPAGDDW